MTKIRNERGDITIDFTERFLKSSLREYYENLYINKPENRIFEQHYMQI